MPRLRFVSVARTFALAASLVVPATAYASTITYADAASFQAALQNSVVDTYSAAGYQHGDKFDGPTQDFFSDAAVSAVFGETDYKSTGFANFDLIVHDAANDYYCAGCNGSFQLSFTDTTVGDTSGVYGAGFNFINTGNYVAFVTFGDASTANYQLPFAAKIGDSFTSFFGITSDLAVSSIHLGLQNGGATNNAVFAIDNLTIGDQSTASAVPDATSSLALFAIGLSAVMIWRR